MVNFVQELAAWQPFFATLAAVCATLAGLLFVALSLHAATLRASHNANLKRLAQHTFGDFIMVLFVGLFFLIPGALRTFEGLALILIVGVGSRQVPDLCVQALRDEDASRHRQYLFKRMGLSLLARALLLTGAGALLLQHEDHVDVWQDLLYVFIGATTLLIAATRNAWFLLVHELG
jgi:hypothetical protein